MSIENWGRIWEKNVSAEHTQTFLRMEKHNALLVISRNMEERETLDFQS